MRKTLFALLILISTNSFAKTLYVNGSATGLNNGTSWVDAFIKIDSAMVHAIKGDTIKVAAGIYKPTEDTDSDRAFGLGNGIVFLGGYPNTGNPSDFQRNWSEFQTVLSGSIGQNYLSHVVLQIQLIDTTTLLDGFFIRAGYGAAISIKNSTSLTIRNTVFEQNQYHVVHVEGSSVAFTNCVFNNNVYFTTVIHNSLGSNTTFNNCIVTGNETEDRDVSSLFINEDASLKIINCDIVNNKGSVFFSKGTGNTTVRNCIIWNNRNTNGAFEDNDISPLNQSLIIDHCITQTYYNKAINTLLDNTDPRFLNIKKPAGNDNKFFSADDGLQLLAPCSPALNYGDNNAISNIEIDILGRPRIYNNGIVDLGAYELQSNVGNALKTVFVNSSTANTGNNDGSSWQNAFKTLQEAFFYCADTIKIAEGIYYTTNSNSDSAFLLENGKVVLGGYPSTGSPTDNDRNPDKYSTVLKRYNNNVDYYVTKNTILKSYHNDSSTIIDGIEFNNESEYSVHHPLLISYESKVKVINCKFLSPKDKLIANGIMITKSSNPSIINSIFDTHQSSNIQGAIVCSGNSAPGITNCIFNSITPFNTQQKTSFAISFTNSSGTIDSCTFTRNSSLTDKSVLYLDNSNSVIKNSVFRSIATWKNVISITNNSTPLIENCAFKNIARSSEYVISIDNSSPVFNKCLFDSAEYFIKNVNHSSPVFNNCVSINGVFMKNNLSSPIVNNSTIINTSTFTSAKRLVINENNSVFTASNTIFWSDKLDPDEMDIYDNKSVGSPSQNSSSYLRNCITQKYGTNGTDGNVVGKNPRFFQLTNIYGPDGKIFTDDDGIKLARCSPAINSGNASTPVLSTDILDKTRIIDGTIDIGAYEFQEAFNGTSSYYVNSKSIGNNSGEDWQNAYNNLQEAICNACADTIRVAQGIYRPAILARDSTFFINRALSLFGGFPDSGNPGDEQRDILTYATILSGNIGNPADSTDNSNTIITITGISDSVIIDGFEIRDSYMNGGTRYNALGGGGICAYYNHTNIRNCRFFNNVANPRGGAISINRLATSTISKCIFSNNYAQNEGGAVSFNGIRLELLNCVFEKNHSINGGAVKLDSDSAIIYNNVFYKNFAHNGGRGGAIYGKNGKVYNCTFLENYTTKPDMLYGGAIFGGNGGLRIWNCIFKGNMLGNSTTTLGADLDWNGNYSYVTNSLLQSKRQYVIAPNLYEIDPNFLNSSNPKGADGKWLTADDGLQLNFSSLAIDYGDNVIINGVSSDILNNERVYNNIVDLGAYEFQNRPLANAGKDTTICAGTNIKIGTKGNPSHSYKWTSIPQGFVSSDSVVTITPTATTSYILEVSNGNLIATDTITVSITSSVLPSITITTLDSIICQNSTAQFIATSMYGGDSAEYEWQVDGINAGNNSNVFTTNTLADNSTLKVTLTSTVSCASQKRVESNTVTIKVNPNIMPSVVISPSDTIICSGGNITLKAFSENAGDFPSYQWQRNGFNVGNNSEVFTESGLQYETQYRVIMSSSAACALPLIDTSELVIVKIRQPLTPSVTINSSATSICEGSNVTFLALVNNAGVSPLYQWMLNDVPTGTNADTYTTNTLNNNDKLKVVVTSKETCATATTVLSNIITMTVINKRTVSGKAKAPVQSCVNNDFPVGFSSNETPLNSTIDLWESINNAGFQKIASQKYNGLILNFPILNNSSENTKRYFFSIIPPPDLISCTQTINSDTVITTVVQPTIPIIKNDNNTLIVTNPISGSKYTWQKLDNTSWNDIIPSAIGLSYYTNVAGFYRVKSEVLNCVTYSIALEVKLQDSIYVSSNIYLYPNPTTGVLIIDSLNLSDKWKRLDIINIDAGQKLASFDISNLTTVTLHLEYLPAGIYLALFIRENGEMYYKKFVKI